MRTRPEITRVWLGLVAAMGLALSFLAASVPARAGHGDLVQIEAVGAIPLDPDTPSLRPPRDAAVRGALWDAIGRVALEMLPDIDPDQAGTLIREALGKDPHAYTPRYRILEDRGERPALFTQNPDVELEYVVVVEVRVDKRRVRSQLADYGLIVMPVGEAVRVRVRLVLEDLTSYAAYRELRRTLIDDVGVRSVVPLEMERRRAVMSVDGELDPESLLRELMRVADPALRITPLEAAGDSLTLRVAWVPVSPPAASGRGVGTPFRELRPD